MVVPLSAVSIHEGLFSQQCIVFVTVQISSIGQSLQQTRLEKLASNKHFNLLVLFVRYDENEML